MNERWGWWSDGWGFMQKGIKNALMMLALSYASVCGTKG
jgi:hypothetical protein